MLGELYNPKGLALETAKAVLEVEHPLAVNVALGCTNNCSYCYVPLSTKTLRGKMRLPMESPKELVGNQLKKKKDVSGVFISFCTDPFLQQLRTQTEELMELLWIKNIRIATLSKMGTGGSATNREIRHGMTVVSSENKFRNEFEPNTLSPLARIAELQGLKLNWHQYVWVSMEPYPPSAIWKQSLQNLLEELKFVDLIVFGKWNYDKRANTPEARQEYKQDIEVLTDFCKSNKIRLHVKSETLKFASKEFPKA